MGEWTGFGAWMSLSGRRHHKSRPVQLRCQTIRQRVRVDDFGRRPADVNPNATPRQQETCTRLVSLSISGNSFMHASAKRWRLHWTRRASLRSDVACAASSGSESLPALVVGPSRPVGTHQPTMTTHLLSRCGQDCATSCGVLCTTRPGPIRSCKMQGLRLTRSAHGGHRPMMMQVT